MCVSLCVSFCVLCSSVGWAVCMPCFYVCELECAFVFLCLSVCLVSICISLNACLCVCLSVCLSFFYVCDSECLCVAVRAQHHTSTQQSMQLPIFTFLYTHAFLCTVCVRVFRFKHANKRGIWSPAAHRAPATMV